MLLPLIIMIVVSWVSALSVVGGLCGAAASGDARRPARRQSDRRPRDGG
jgi:hypothetical protein